MFTTTAFLFSVVTILILLHLSIVIDSLSLQQGQKPGNNSSPIIIKKNNRNNNDDATSRRSVLKYSLLFSLPSYDRKPANALSPSEASIDYDRYAKNYDSLDGDETVSSLLGIDDARMRLFGKAKGKVLEVGVGTGLNLAKYNPDLVSDLTVVDISDGMIKEARARSSKKKNNNFPIHFIKADATTELTQLFGVDGTFDTVVDSFSLCVMGDEGARNCLEQMSNVLKRKDGKLLLLENSRSSNEFLGWYQDRTAPMAASMGGKGCVYNQNVAAMIKRVNP
eukprot:CAMPEP_0194149826 /NCGR_PEP_ID=MMETSP0152-20130528/40102_1 /TAXON_ID=1049557 /ORGANISM="Thalassiothrix antarctica, Strain L6-D1" /LENGTH=279 /DNA_ID=CAMNT_0038852305 /DNA_START=24 /DNA_END=859 /DNA_ORIENTATION=+